MIDMNEIFLKSDKYTGFIKTIKLLISKDNFQIICSSYEFWKTSVAFWWWKMCN